MVIVVMLFHQKRSVMLMGKWSKTLISVQSVVSRISLVNAKEFNLGVGWNLPMVMVKWGNLMVVQGLLAVTQGSVVQLKWW